MNEPRLSTPASPQPRSSRAPGAWGGGAVVAEAPLQASLIIVAYNARAYLERCLSSVLETSGASCEVILVDNASSDRSSEVAAQKFPQVRVIRNEKNLGFGQGNNLGAQAARGKYLAFLNPDTVVKPGWLEALIQALEDDPRAGLATSKILLLNDPERINTCGNSIHLTGLTLCRGLGRQSKDNFNQRESVAAVSGAAFAIRRKLFEQLGGFDEDFFLYMEDTDLSWRARLAGWDCLYVPESIVLHDYTLRITPLKVFYQERNRYLMLLKCLRWPTLLILLPVLFVAEAVTWGFVLWSDRANLTNKIRAYRWTLSQWSRLRQKSKATQILRQVSDRDMLRQTDSKLDFSQTAPGGMTLLAHLLFDPLFFVLRALVLILVWW